MTLEQTQQRRQSVSTIHDVVGAMRAIAAGRIQGAQRAFAAARRYRDVVLRGIAALAGEFSAPRLPEENGKPPLLLVLTAEQPFCGDFNHNVLALAERRWDELRRVGPARLILVGQRGSRQLMERGIVPDTVEPGVTSLHGLRDLVKRLANEVDRRLAAGEIGSLLVIYSRYQSVSEQTPREDRILPIDLEPFRRPEAPRVTRYYRYLPVPPLLAGLVAEYAFISLYQAAADSYAGEQASRLIAMDGATRNTEKVLESLVELERRERQGQVTRQVLDLLSARFTME